MNGRKLYFAIGVFAALFLGFRFTTHVPKVGAIEHFMEDSSTIGNTSATSEFGAKKSPGAITLKDAISLAISKNQELRVFFLELKAQEARTLQTGLFPNPELDIEIENFAGSGDFSNFDSTETTIQVSQLTELGGKRSKRRKLSYLTCDLAGWDYESKRADVLTEVTKAFIDVVAGQERLALAKEQVGLAEKVFDIVSTRVKAGKETTMEEMKAKIILSINRVLLENTKQKLEVSRRRLAASWGSEIPNFEKADGRLGMISPIPSQKNIENHILLNPDLARWTTEMEQHRAGLALENSKKIPDPTISLGARGFNETDEQAFILGVSVPIPFFNRNQGNILEAKHRLNKAENEHKAARIKISKDLAQAYHTLSNAYNEARALQEEVLPSARWVFNAAQAGYLEGKFDYLDVLDAQRTLFETKARYVNVLAAYHKTKAGVERLIGTTLENLKTSGEFRKEVNDE